MSSADEVFKERDPQGYRHLEGQVEMFYDGIIAREPDSPNKIPEYIFVNHLLPLFSGQLTSDEKQLAISQWIAVAGSPYSSIDVIDNVTRDYLFTIPPYISNKLFTGDLFNRGKSVADIYEGFSSRSSLTNVAQQYLRQELAKKEDQVLSKTINLDREKLAWKNILERYGVEMETSPTIIEEKRSSSLLRPKTIIEDDED